MSSLEHVSDFQYIIVRQWNQKCQDMDLLNVLRNIIFDLFIHWDFSKVLKCLSLQGGDNQFWLG